MDPRTENLVDECKRQEESCLIETLRRRLLKIGARVKETPRRIWVHLASSYPLYPHFLPTSLTVYE